MNTEKPIGTGESAFLLTRADIEQLRSAVQSAAQLDLHLQNLQEIDLSYMDLQGADLSTARLNGPELQGAILHHGAFRGSGGEYLDRGKRVAPAQATRIEEHFLSLQEQESKQIVSDREAYLFGEHALLVGFDPVKLRGLFPQGFAFALAHPLFDIWLVQMGDNYNEQTREAIWIGFAHRICDLYHENEPEA